VINTVSKKWLIIGGVVGASIAGVFGGLYLAGYMVRKSTEQIIKQIQTTPPLPPTTLSTPPTQSVTAPPPSPPQQNLPQTQGQQQQQVQLRVGGVLGLPPVLPPPCAPCPPQCPPGTIPAIRLFAEQAHCPIVTTSCGAVCVPANDILCIGRIRQLEGKLIFRDILYRAFYMKNTEKEFNICGLLG